MLESIIDGENVILYRYNKDGIRIGKTVNGIETEYLLDENNKMIGEKCGNDIIWYLYDSEDEISGFEWNGTDYYYVKNEVGDVQGIADKDGTVRCMYDYDIWGKLTDMTGDKELGKSNPVRYRGYYYDEETGLYYLNTRYYDPEMKRFLNRDMLDNETNLYQYCYNNPVLYSDKNGMTAYGCSDTNLTAINNVSGYIRNDEQINNVQDCIAKYYNRSQYAYFNCYLWTLNIFVVDKTNFNTGQITVNEIGIMGTPGYILAWHIMVHYGILHINKRYCMKKYFINLKITIILFVFILLLSVNNYITYAETLDYCSEIEFNGWLIAGM